MVKNVANNERAKAWYAANKERALANGRKWVSANKERVHANKTRWVEDHRTTVSAYSRKWQQANPQKVKAMKLAYAKAHPERQLAQSAIFCALIAGRITPLPCWVCGAEKTEAHHPDYDTPLDVVWLCRRHHRQLHLQSFL